MKTYRFIKEIVTEEKLQSLTVDVSEENITEIVCAITLKLTDDSTSGSYFQVFDKSIRIFETNQVYNNNIRGHLLEASIIDGNFIKVLATNACVIEFANKVCDATAKVGFLRNSGKTKFEELTFLTSNSSSVMEAGAVITIYGR